MRGTISKSGSNDSLAAERSWNCGGQGVHREVESEGHEEKYRAVMCVQPRLACSVGSSL